MIEETTNQLPGEISSGLTLETLQQTQSAFLPVYSSWIEKALRKEYEELGNYVCQRGIFSAQTSEAIPNRWLRLVDECEGTQGSLLNVIDQWRQIADILLDKVFSIGKE